MTLRRFLIPTTFVLALAVSAAPAAAQRGHMAGGQGRALPACTLGVGSTIKAGGTMAGSTTAGSTITISITA